MTIERRINTILAVLLVVSGSITTYIATRLYSTYHNTTEVKLLKQRVDSLESQIKIDKDAVAEKLKLMYETLYESQVDVKTAADKVSRRPSVIEQSQLNNNKEFRSRLTVLERWRFEVDRKLDRIR